MTIILNMLKSKTTIIVMIKITKNICKKTILLIKILEIMTTIKPKNNIKLFLTIHYLQN
jgi:hypothetical protein